MNRSRLKTIRSFGIMLSAVLLLGCHESGTWRDDAGNWKRIFRVKMPANVQVVHSWFWRSPHFTYEFEYYLQIAKNEDFQRRLLTMNPMREVREAKELNAIMAGSQQHRPAWFAPKPVADYGVWIYSNAPASSFRLLIDQKTGDLFLADLQL